MEIVSFDSKIRNLVALVRPVREGIYHRNLSVIAINQNLY